MTPTPKDQLLLDQLDTLDRNLVSIVTAVDAAAAASGKMRTIINTTVPPPVVGPVAGFTYAPAGDPAYPRKLLFKGTPVGMSSYAWTWGNGTSETHPFPDTAKTYPTDGTYNVTLEVTDAAGLKNAITKAVVVRFSTLPPDPIPIPPDPNPIPPDPTMPPDEKWANPPAIYITSTRPTVTGKTIDVPVGGNVQAALDNAQPGDEVTFDNSGKYVGNFIFRQKTGSNGWITLRPKNMAFLPKPGDRRTTIAGAPIVHSSNNLGVFATDPGAARYWIIGLEGAQPATIANTGFIRLGQGETSLAALPRQFVLEQVYLHGTPTGILRRAVTLNGVDMSVLDSLITECHDKGPDSQAIAGWNGPGPFRIINCGLSAASENVIFGGTDPSIAGLIPSDIEIRRCHLWKDPAWKGGGWAVKNLWELKNARRVLLEACVMDGSWADGQVGYHTNLKSVNQDGTAPWCHIEDVMMRYCIVKNVGSGYNLIGVDPGATVASERLTLMHNLIDGFTEVGDQRGVQVLNRPIDAEVIHCTILSPQNSSLTFGGPASPASELPVRFVYRDNISGNGQYGVKGPGLNTADTFKAFMQGGKYKGNVLIGPDGGSSYPAGNSFAPTEADVGFVSKTDRRLAATSKYKGKATDGTDPGADMAKVYSMTAGVVVPAT